jgi:solute carrier family 29 (equilibrative nucleoside transporter), member 1/2/3
MHSPHTSPILNDERRKQISESMKGSEREREEMVASIMFIAIGVGYLFPFSALTQPVDYWTLMFPDFEMDFPITATYMWLNLIALGILVFGGADDPSGTYDIRMYVGFIGQFLVLFIVPTSYFFFLSEDGNYYIIIGATAFAAIVTALIDSCAISLSSQYPKSCQAALQVGIGMSTLIGSVYRLFTKAFFPSDMVVQSSLLYFYSGSVTVLACIGSYIYLKNMPISKKTLAASASGMELSEYSPLRKEQSQQGREIDMCNESNYGTTSTSTDREGESDEHLDKWDIFGRALFNESMVFVCFASTLCLWPPFVSEIPSASFPSMNETKWWPLLMLFVFAVSDVIGRFTVPYRMGLTKDNIWIPICIRAIVYPPIMIALVQGVIANDVVATIVVGTLGFTNGYLGSLSIILVNESVKPAEKGIVGTLTGFVLNFGLLVGATVAMFLQDIFITHHEV